MIDRLIKILFLLSMALLFSCEKYVEFPGCGICDKEEPTRVELEFKLDFSYNVMIQVDIYDGELSDSILYASYRLSGGEVRYWVTLNKQVTATAAYTINKKKYTVVDSVLPGCTLDDKRCDDPCYFVHDYKLDLRLKYTK
jgi:hypothetical protein